MYPHLHIPIQSQLVGKAAVTDSSEIMSFLLFEDVFHRNT